MPTFINFNSISGVSTVSVDTSISVGSGIGVTAKGLTGVESINAGSISGARNRIINGDMRIDQRNAGASATISGDPIYNLDRWAGYKGTVPNFTIIRSGTVPVGFTSSLLATMGTGTSPGSTGYAAFGQRIEGFNIADLLWGTSNAKSVTLSFWVNCSVTGTFGVSFRNANQDTTYCSTYTINSTNTWEYKIITVPGVTTGTWFTDNRSGIEIYWDLGVGTTYSGTAGQVNSGTNYFGVTGTTKLCSTTGATFYLTGVQLEVGSSATAFERRSYGQELALCQRYCLVDTNNSQPYRWFASGHTATTTYAYVGRQLPVTMRTAPSLTVSNGTQFYLDAPVGGQVATSVVDTGFASASVVRITVNISGGTANVPCWLASDSNASLRSITYSAEL